MVRRKEIDIPPLVKNHSAGRELGKIRWEIPDSELRFGLTPVIALDDRKEGVFVTEKKNVAISFHRQIKDLAQVYVFSETVDLHAVFIEDRYNTLINHIYFIVCSVHNHSAPLIGDTPVEIGERIEKGAINRCRRRD
jgi:hypothetical protein